jgi:hypothetical protein
VTVPYTLLQQENDRLEAKLLVTQTLAKLATEERDAARRDLEALRSTCQAAYRQHDLTLLRDIAPMDLRKEWD